MGKAVTDLLTIAAAFDTDSRRRLVPRGIEEALTAYLTNDVPRLRESRQPAVHGRAIRDAIRGKTFARVPPLLAPVGR